MMAVIGGRAHNIEMIHEVGRLGYPYAEISLLDPEVAASEVEELVKLKEQYGLYYLAHYPNENQPVDTKILKEKFPVNDIILFGSKARGDSDEASDIDLFLVTKHSIHWKERQAIIHALFDLGMKHDVIFSILDTPEGNIRKGLFSAFPVYDEIMKEGVPAP